MKKRLVFLRWAGVALVAASAFTSGCQPHGRQGAETAAPEQGPGNADELAAQGRAALRRGDPTRAEQYFKLALEKGGVQTELVKLLVQTCIAQSRLRAALNYADPYLIEHPEELALRYLVATIHLSLGHEADAHRHLVILTRRAPDYPDAHFLLGLMLERAERTAAARRSYEQYLVLAPTGELAAEARDHLLNLEFDSSAQSREELSQATAPPSGSVLLVEEQTQPARMDPATGFRDVPSPTESNKGTSTESGDDSIQSGGDK